jgi:hypothetical protein
MGPRTDQLQRAREFLLEGVWGPGSHLKTRPVHIKAPALRPEEESPAGLS